MTEKVVLKVQKTFEPLPPIKSVRSSTFIINVPHDDHQHADTIKRLGGNEIQKTFTLP